MKWTTVEAPDTAGDYARLQLDGRDVAAMRRRRKEAANLWVPGVWVESVDRTAARAGDLGATIVGTYNVPGIARTVTIQDPQGAVFGLWEPAPLHGVQIIDQPGS